MNSDLINDIIAKILCRACEGRGKAELLYAHQVRDGEWELDTEQIHPAVWVCQRCKNHPGIDPIWTIPYDGALWLDRVPINPENPE